MQSVPEVLIQRTHQHTKECKGCPLSTSIQVRQIPTFKVLLAITNDKIMVKWLLEHGASLAEINKAGKIPGDLCTNEQVLKMLKKPL
jgi:hypothetical protein